jgi:hypothetical protein
LRASAIVASAHAGPHFRPVTRAREPAAARFASALAGRPKIRTLRAAFGWLLLTCRILGIRRLELAF